MISESRLNEIFSNYRRITIGLVGDLFLDRYLEIEPESHELSVETGIEAYQISSVRNAPGALGTVMNNLAALGIGMLRPATVIGDDGHGYDLLKELRAIPLDASYIIKDADRLTPTYTKPMKPEPDGGVRELNRLDVRTRTPLSDTTTNKLCHLVSQVFDSTDGLIVLDQISEDNLGVVNDRVRGCLRDLAKSDPEKLILVDSRAHLDQFDFGCLKGNQAEFLAAAEETDSDADSMRRAAAKLAARTGRPAYGTIGSHGSVIGHPDGTTTEAPGFPVSGPIDIVGAGDSATSAIVASLLCGATELEAATIANLAASITVQQIGTTGTATTEQIVQRLHDNASQA